MVCTWTAAGKAELKTAWWRQGKKASRTGSGRYRPSDELEVAVRQEVVDLHRVARRPAGHAHPPARWGASQPTQRRQMPEHHDVHHQVEVAEEEERLEGVRVGSLLTCPGRDLGRS